ncbi:MAG TPA: alpha-2-macroglobulin family protein, partial [Pirellulales bacterium]|nr:alpha-2-macroglobulin family protein [Pirellulales bacterium]
MERAEKEARRDAEALRKQNDFARMAKDGAPVAPVALPQLEQQQLAGKRAGGQPNMMGRPGWPGPRGDLAFQPQLPQFEPFIVREYAHASRSRPDGAAREDFAETLYWNPALVISSGGSQNFSFDLCDSVTTFQVMAFGYTPDGRLGAASAEVRSVLPFTVEPKLPLEVTSSDRIDLPVKVSNNGAADRDVTIKAEANGLKLDGADSQDFTVAANSHARKIFRFQPTITDGNAQLTLTGESKPFAGDSIVGKIRVVPDGFPVVKSKSDLLEGQAANEVALPETWVKGTLRCQVEVFPSTLADLQKGLESLLREPNGCFEQTSTSNYPNLLILDYLKESDQAKPEVERQAREKLSRGYAKLTSFECRDPAKDKREGYEWFGGAAPPHEALTAYGLLQFRDMARVHDVDPAMLRRTRDYLMNQRDGHGGFKRNPRALDSFGRAPDDVTNAYIVWSLTESGKDDDVTRELNALAEKAKGSKDPYF